jgi:hypothetical protein
MLHWQQNPNGQYLIKTEWPWSTGESEKRPVDSLQSNTLQDLKNTIIQISQRLSTLEVRMGQVEETNNTREKVIRSLQQQDGLFYADIHELKKTLKNFTAEWHNVFPPSNRQHSVHPLNHALGSVDGHSAQWKNDIGPSNYRKNLDSVDFDQPTNPPKDPP